MDLTGDFPDSDVVVVVSSEQGVSVVRPGDGDWRGSLLGDSTEFREGLVQGGNEGSRFQIPDSEFSLGGSNEPVSGWGEDQGIDFITGFEVVQSLSFVQVPEEDLSVFTSRSAEGSVRGDGDRGDVSSVSNEVGLELAVAQSPDLDELVPSSGDDDWVTRESDAGNPFSVSLVFDGVLAFSESVPQLDGLVSGSRNDLSVIERESNRQDVLGVSEELSGGDSSVDIPESQGSVPRSRQGELSVGGNSEILNKVGVSNQNLLGNTIGLFRLLGQVPYEESLISRSRDEGIWVFSGGSSNAGNPTSVSLEDSSESKSNLSFRSGHFIEL